MGAAFQFRNLAAGEIFLMHKACDVRSMDAHLRKHLGQCRINPVETRALVGAEPAQQFNGVVFGILCHGSKYSK